jgi:hypothetical protein
MTNVLKAFMRTETIDHHVVWIQPAWQIGVCRSLHSGMIKDVAGFWVNTQKRRCSFLVKEVLILVLAFPNLPIGVTAPGQHRQDGPLSSQL